ncbi:MAG: hypothetical protein JWO44_2329 [Bacteroidetes bacterium]|nr:hypothetical protein [Bacteroidota bacterium]
MATTSSQNILDKLFSGDFFKNVDTAGLLKQFDTSSALRQESLAAKPAAVPIALTGNSISSIPPEGIVISTSGQYQFSNDITWTPASPGSAITIEADNVVLDLQGYTLSASIPGIDQQYNGICITGGSDVTVQGGTINGISYRGVSASNTANLQISNMNIGNISYKEVTTGYLTPSGIFIDSSTGFSVQSCTVQNISVTTPSCAGIQIIESTNGSVSGCTMTNFLNNDGAVQGFSYLLCSQILTTGCSCETFQSSYLGQTITSGHTVIGYVPIFCIELVFNDCSSTDMTGCCDDCHGMSIFLDAIVEVNNFSATNVTDGAGPRKTGAKATGLEVYGVSVGINSCTVENITAIVPQDLQSAGFSAWGESITFYNCTATNVVVTDASKVPSTQYGYGTGFGWAPDPRKEFNGQPANMVQYNNCTSNNCQLGFDTWFHTNSQWQNVNAPGCPIFILVQPDTASRILSMDKCSESPDGQPHTVTIYNIAANNEYPPQS